MPTFTDTAQKMRFSIKDFFRKLRIRSHLLKKLLMENFILYAVWSNPQEKISFFDKWKYLTLDTFKILFEDVGAIEQNFLFPSVRKVYAFEVSFGLYFSTFGLKPRFAEQCLVFRIRENTNQKKLQFQTLFTQCKVSYTLQPEGLHKITCSHWKGSPI